MKRFLSLLLMCISVCFLVCCKTQDSDRDFSLCRVVIEDKQDVVVIGNGSSVTRGENLTFRLYMQNGCMLQSVDYPHYQIEEREEAIYLTLFQVKYSTIIQLKTAYEQITYIDGNEQKQVKNTVQREKVNTLPYGTFQKEGHTQVGWKNEEQELGLGSRVSADCKQLHAVWEQQNEGSDFSYELRGDCAYLTAYFGGERCVIPQTIDGKLVKGITANAFQNRHFQYFVSAPTLMEVEAGAFQNCTFEKLSLFDGVSKCSTAAWQNCKVKNLQLLANTAPKYSATYYNTFPDKMNRLQSMQGKKMVLFSGSSARYGYDSPRMEREFSQYQVVNMGVYAYTNALPQLEMIARYMQEGDLLVEAPEFDIPDLQFCLERKLDYHFFRMVEGDYSLLNLLDFSQYEEVFSSLCTYFCDRSAMLDSSYDTLPSSYDDEGREISYATYNEYGDYILKRPNAKNDEMHRVIRTDYTVNSITNLHINSLNQVMQNCFLGQGVEVVFTFAPVNRASLTQQSTEWQRQLLQKQLEQQLIIPVISNMENYIYSGVYFYEIDNHLSTEGVAMRTEQIIFDLQSYRSQHSKK